MRRLWSLLREEKGAVLVLSALGMVAFLLLVALVADVGWVYTSRVKMSNAVDAAVFAGVQELPLNPGQAEYIARDYSTRNGLESENVTVTFSEANHRITVTGQREIPLFFGGILGSEHAAVAVRASARVTSVGGIRGAVPFGVVKQSFVFGRQYTLKEGAGPGGSVHSGNFGALALGGRGASIYLNNIKYGYQGLLRVGDWVETQPGNIAGKTEQGIRFRQQSCQHATPCSWDHFEPECPRILLVPVIDSLEVNGRGEVLIVGFAAFFIEGMQKGPKGQLDVIGRFLQMVVDGEQGGTNDYGLLTVELVE